MEKDQLFNHAQKMFITGAGRKAVMDFLKENGVPDNEVGNMATEAYKSVREKIQQMKIEAGQENANVGEVPSGESSGGGGGVGSMVIGFLLLGGGIVLTMATDRIWYGAMAVGLFSIVGGIVKMAR